MRTRRRLTWLIFIICILAVLEGLGWVTWHSLRLERREREARAATQFQQTIRLALWRMESEITPIIAAEAARPYFHYIPFYSAERAYTKMFQQVKPNEVLVPSPLLETSGRFIRLHYQIDPDGVVSSPQAPTGNMRDLAEAQYLDSEFIVLAGQMLEEVVTMVRPAHKQPVATLGAASVPPPPAPATPPSEPIPQQVAAAPQLEQKQISEGDTAEYAAREKAAKSAQQTANLPENQRRKGGQIVDRADRTQAPLGQPQAGRDSEAAASKPTPVSDPQSVTGLGEQPAEDAKTRARVSDPRDETTKKEQERQSLLKDFQEAAPQIDPSRVEQASFAARWCTGPRTGEDELILERPVLIDGRETRQGIWIDWPQLRDQLKSSVADLLPAASLCPATDAAAAEAGQRLAAVPVRLLPGPLPTVAALPMSPTHITLLVTWVAVLGAIGAIGFVLRKALELSERRGRFVSAVTHELRTPLTTFCLYTEMLSDGMVADEAVRREYLQTLRGESGRLARIVQNVLDYAGIGGVGRRTTAPGTPIRTMDLVERVRPTLDQSARRAGMTLEISTQGLESATLNADPQTVERILLNLVENSCKYAAESSDRRIEVSVRTAPDRSRERPGLVVFAVRDHGPGIPKSERRKIFHAFHRAERDAHSSKSGLGLGLALARELARELGGKLTLSQAVTEGAEFHLSLPTIT